MYYIEILKNIQFIYKNVDDLSMNARYLLEYTSTSEGEYIIIRAMFIDNLYNDFLIILKILGGDLYVYSKQIARFLSNNPSGNFISGGLTTFEDNLYYIASLLDQRIRHINLNTDIDYTIITYPYQIDLEISTDPFLDDTILTGHYNSITKYIYGGIEYIFCSYYSLIDIYDNLMENVPIKRIYLYSNIQSGLYFFDDFFIFISKSTNGLTQFKIVNYLGNTLSTDPPFSDAYEIYNFPTIDIDDPLVFKKENERISKEFFTCGSVNRPYLFKIIRLNLNDGITIKVKEIYLDPYIFPNSNKITRYTLNYNYFIAQYGNLTGNSYNNQEILVFDLNNVHSEDSDYIYPHSPIRYTNETGFHINPRFTYTKELLYSEMYKVFFNLIQYDGSTGLITNSIINQSFNVNKDACSDYRPYNLSNIIKLGKYEKYVMIGPEISYNGYRHLCFFRLTRRDPILTDNLSIIYNKIYIKLVKLLFKLYSFLEAYLFII